MAEITRQLAQDYLENNKLEYFCAECGMPRRKNYCPVKVTPRHIVFRRDKLSLNAQIELLMTSHSREVKQIIK